MRLSKFIVAALSYLLVLPTICFATTYTITNFGLYTPVGINNAGQVALNSGASDVASLYSDGTITSLGSLFPPNGSQATAINDAGQVAGWSPVAPFGRPHAVLFSGGGIRDLGILPSTDESFSMGINGNGQVVGLSGNSANIGAASAFLYSNGTMHDLNSLISPPSGWVLVNAIAINNNMQMAGTALLNGQETTYLYSGGALTNLGSDFGITGINQSGQIVAYNDLGNGIDAVVYSGGQWHDLGAPNPFGSVGFGINNFGQVVGYGPTLPDSSINHALLYSGGSWFDLNSLVNPSSGWILGKAVGINDSGQIVGIGTLHGQSAGFLLTPTPEPSSLVLAALGFIGLAAWGWRRRRQFIPS